MKNIHVLPTLQPSRLCIDDSCNELNYSEVEGLNSKHITNQNIFITNDEDIKEGWHFNSSIGVNKKAFVKEEDIKVLKSIYGDRPIHLRKIILTTDTQLIEDGIQAINDDFLEWFVQNTSCEKVEVLRCPIEGLYTIIPKQEQKQHLIDMMKSDEELGLYDDPKQDNLQELLKLKEIEFKETQQPYSQETTLEEVAENKKNLYYYKQIMNPYPVEEYSYTAYEKGFVDGYEKASKWQQKQDKKMYSEEDLREAFESNYDSQNYGNSNLEDDFKELLEQFKKK